MRREDASLKLRRKICLTQLQRLPVTALIENEATGYSPGYTSEGCSRDLIFVFPLRSCSGCRYTQVADNELSSVDRDTPLAQ